MNVDGKNVKEGARTRVGGVELIALQVCDGAVRQIGLDLDPPPEQTSVTLLKARAKEGLRSVRELFLDDSSGPF